MRILQIFGVFALIISYPFYNPDFLTNITGFVKVLSKNELVSNLTPDVMCFVEASNILDHCICLDKLQRTIKLGVETYNHISNELKCFSEADSEEVFIDCVGDIETQLVADFVCAALITRKLTECEDLMCFKNNIFNAVEGCGRIPHFKPDELFKSIFEGVLYLLEPNPNHHSHMEFMLEAISNLGITDNEESENLPLEHINIIKNELSNETFIG